MISALTHWGIVQVIEFLNQFHPLVLVCEISVLHKRGPVSYCQLIFTKTNLMKAFLGMGLLGSNFVKAMIKKNEAVQVWNRTFSKAEELAGVGAKPFKNLSDAVKNADVIHITLKDDDSVNEVLRNAQSALKPGAIIIDHTTTSVSGAIERTNAWNGLGFTYQHAPVFMGPANALESSGFML